MFPWEATHGCFAKHHGAWASLHAKVLVSSSIDKGHGQVRLRYGLLLVTCSPVPTVTGSDDQCLNQFPPIMPLRIVVREVARHPDGEKTISILRADEFNKPMTI